MQKSIQKNEQNKDFDDVTAIWIRFDEKYGQEYNLVVELCDDLICIQRTNSDEVYYEDNGLINYIKKIKIKYGNKN